MLLLASDNSNQHGPRLRNWGRQAEGAGVGVGKQLVRDNGVGVHTAVIGFAQPGAGEAGVAASSGQSPTATPARQIDVSSLSCTKSRKPSDAKAATAWSTADGQLGWAHHSAGSAATGGALAPRGLRRPA